MTIARQTGCTAFDVGLQLADRLNRDFPSDIMWTVYDKEIVHQIAENLHMSERLVETLTDRSSARISDYMDSFFEGRPTIDTVYQETLRVVHQLCEKGHAIIIGRAGCVIGAGSPRGFHLRLTAPAEWRVEQLAAAHGLDREEAETRVRVLTEEREDLFEKATGRNASDPELYDMTLNMSQFSPEGLIDIAVKAIETKGLVP